MKAVRFHEHGGPEVLIYEDAPVPQIGPGDALIKVRACALNHLDLSLRRGLPGVTISLPHILGCEVAGEVAATGGGAHHPSVGMACFVHPGIPGGPTIERLRGDDNIAPDYTILGFIPDGGYAEYVRVPADNVISKPENLSWEEAAAFPLTFLTAWHMLGPRRACLRAGETVLIIGANSGVGTAAIQVAKVMGARVIATVGSAEKAAKARKLGADEVIDHYERKDEIHKAVYALTQGAGVDVVVEHVGPAVFTQCVKALKRGGRLVTCGATSGPKVELDLRMLFAKHLTIYGSYMGSMSETLELLPLIERGILKPVVDKVFPLEQAADAHQRLEGSEHFGKIVLSVP
ncbi:zinc-binding dehydrogenase [bacterium]|nr:zinc-binding dehydrogenase [bacterium]